MDIMNNMTVSTSKLTFSLIAIVTLLIAGSAFTNQEASAAVTFTATHNTTTQTDVTFNENVNGTLDVADWKITATGARGEALSATITFISNSSSHPITHMNNAGNSNLINRTAGPIFIHHTAIPSDATLNVNYTAQENSSGVHVGASNGLTDGLGFVSDATRNVIGSNEVFMVAALDRTADDQMIPTALSADIIKANPKQIRILMSEQVTSINSTESGFTLVTSSFGSNGIANHENVVSSFIAQNTTTDKYIYVNMVNPAKEGDVFTIAYTTANGGIIGNYWITDSINSELYDSHLATSGPHKLGGLGNRLANFSAITIVNYVNTDGLVGNLENCYDCSAPQVTKVQVSLDSSIPITVTNDNPVKINAGVGDTVTLMVTVSDNNGAATIPFAGLYTNFGATPDNLFYANNFDSTKQMSTSYYEWNIRDDDIAFDNDGAITWTDATAKVNVDRTKTITYTMSINDSVDSSQVWVDIGDKVGNYAKLALPVTLEVSGAPAITFASDDSQKVVSFFNESILLAIVSQWTTTSSNDASNVEQLSSVLGIENQLPTWTTDLASWVADDKIDVADMIVAVEYVINQ